MALGRSVAVTGPSETSVAEVVRFGSIAYVPPSEAARAPHDVLLVDEAAAIPVPLLAGLLVRPSVAMPRATATPKAPPASSGGMPSSSPSATPPTAACEMPTPTKASRRSTTKKPSAPHTQSYRLLLMPVQTPQRAHGFFVARLRNHRICPR